MYEFPSPPPNRWFNNERVGSHYPNLLDIPIPQELIDYHQLRDLRLRWIRVGRWDYPRKKTWLQPQLKGGLMYDTLWNEKRIDKSVYPVWAKPGAYVYECGICEDEWIDKRPRNLIRTICCPRCQAAKVKRARDRVQYLRFEGEQFGRLSVIERTLAGWMCVCLGTTAEGCGNVVGPIPSQQLVDLRKLACQECCPEEWDGKRGKRPLDSVHVWLKREHLSRVDATIVP